MVYLGKNPIFLLSNQDISFGVLAVILVSKPHHHQKCKLIDSQHLKNMNLFTFKHPHPMLT